MIAFVAVITVFSYKQGKRKIFCLALTLLIVCMPFKTKEYLTVDSTATTAYLSVRESSTVTEWEMPCVMIWSKDVKELGLTFPGSFLTFYPWRSGSIQSPRWGSVRLFSGVTTPRAARSDLHNLQSDILVKYRRLWPPLQLNHNQILQNSKNSS